VDVVHFAIYVLKLDVQAAFLVIFLKVTKQAMTARFDAHSHNDSFVWEILALT
jgi:hypothetical protein